MSSATSSSFHSPSPISPQARGAPPSSSASSAYHADRPDVILMAITSQVRPTTAVGEVPVTHVDRSGLLKPSVIKPVIATIARELIIRKLGRLLVRSWHTHPMRRMLVSRSSRLNPSPLLRWVRTTSAPLMSRIGKSPRAGWQSQDVTLLLTPTLSAGVSPSQRGYARNASLTRKSDTDSLLTHLM